MRFKIALRIFAESEVTGEAVELCPGELVEWHPTLAQLMTNLEWLTQQGWDGREQHELWDFHTQLYHEGEAVTRVFEQRERAQAAAAREERPPRPAARPRRRRRQAPDPG